MSSEIDSRDVSIDDIEPISVFSNTAASPDAMPVSNAKIITHCDSEM